MQQSPNRRDTPATRTAHSGATTGTRSSVDSAGPGAYSAASALCLSAIDSARTNIWLPCVSTTALIGPPRRRITPVRCSPPVSPRRSTLDGPFVYADEQSTAVDDWPRSDHLDLAYPTPIDMAADAAIARLRTRTTAAIHRSLNTVAPRQSDQDAEQLIFSGTDQLVNEFVDGLLE